MLEKKCKTCGCEFEISLKDKEFYDKMSPIFAGAKYEINMPGICPKCTLNNNFTWRNERNLYKTKCDLTGKDIISIFSPDKPYKVYEQFEWWSDKWNAISYGKDFDFSKSFFSQFEDLYLRVPKLSLYNVNIENSEYNNGIISGKDSYMNIYGGNLENAHYTSVCEGVKDSLDIWWSAYIENSYECISCDRLYNCHYCIDTSDGVNLLFCENCLGCSDSMFCYNLKNAKYCIENKEYSKEEYEKISKEILNGSYKDLENLKKRNRDFIIKLPHKYRFEQRSENCTGDYIFESINSEDVFVVVGVEDCKNIFEGGRLKDCQNSAYVYDSKLILNSISTTENNYKLSYCINVSSSKNLLYCIDMQNCSDCFGSTGLVNKSFCILNKEYSKEEYDVLVPKIIEHMKRLKEWSELFPVSLSPFGYNETVAMEHFPLSKEEVLNKKIYKWSDYENPAPVVTKIIPASKLPDNIKDTPDDILNWAIECAMTNKPFRIIKPELLFYRSHNLPIPRHHPDVRHLDRRSQRNRNIFHDRHCDNCNKEIRTSFSPGNPEIVYCEDCFNKFSW